MPERDRITDPEEARDFFEREGGWQALEGAEEAKGAFLPRWSQLWAYWRNDPDVGEQPYADLRDEMRFHYPLLQPKVDALVAHTVAPIIYNHPYFTVSKRRTYTTRERALEEWLDHLFSISDFETELRNAVRHIAIAGVAPVMTFFERRETEEGQERFRFRFLVVAPEDFYIFPDVEDVSRASLVGHSFVRRKRELLAKAKEGEYFYEVVERLRGSAGFSQTGVSDRPRVQPATSYEGEKGKRLLDEDIELQDVLLRTFDEKGGKEVWYRFVVSKSNRAVLKAERFPYPRPWYARLAFHEEGGAFWVRSSPAHNLQTVQKLYNHLLNTIGYGSFLSAFPAVYGLSASLDKANMTYLPGKVHPTDAPKEMQVISGQVNAQGLWLMVQKIEQIADRAIGISDPGVGAPLSGRRTATEAAYIQQGFISGVNERISYLARRLGGVAEYVWLLMRKHKDELGRIYGEEFMKVMQDLEEEDLIFEVTGKSAGTLPSLQQEMLFNFAMMAMRTPAAQAVNWVELLRHWAKVAGAVPTDLVYTDEELQRQAMMAQAMQSGMLPGGEEGVLQGVPGIGGGAPEPEQEAIIP